MRSVAPGQKARPVRTSIATANLRCTLAPSPNLRCVALLALLTACKGPELHIDNPDGHTVFLDGVQTDAIDIPFRYYGTTRWDAQPVDRDPFGEWTKQPASQLVTISPPASGALFPFDLPVELVSRLFGGRGDVTTTIELPTTQAQQLAETEQANAQLGALMQRAQQARLSR